MIKELQDNKQHMTFFDIKTPFKGNGVYKLKVKDKTTRTLTNGVVIPTWEAMLREAAKI